MTSAAAVDAAVQAGVDAVGFVFAPSKRQVNAKQAQEFAHAVPSRIARIAVMQHPSQHLVDDVLTVFKPDVLQTDWEDIAELKLPNELTVLPVLRAGRALPSSLATRILFEGPVSGTGETADWSRAAQLASQAQLILAGGLNANNVADAIRRVRPFGVDVSSGVESAPGVKDPQKIFEFVRTAKEEVSSEQ